MRKHYPMTHRVTKYDRTESSNQSLELQLGGKMQKDNKNTQKRHKHMQKSNNNKNNKNNNSDNSKDSNNYDDNNITNS